MSDAVKEFAALMGGEVEETGRKDDGDFDPTWDTSEATVLIGRYNGFRGPVGKYNKRVHKFADAQLGNGPDDMIPVGNIEAWGSTVLDQRLDDYSKGDRVLVVYEGVAEGSGAHIYRTYRAKGVVA